jgi:6-phosphogluconolactonase
MRVFDDAEALAAHAAQWLCALARGASGAFAVALSGGSTPRRLYQLLAEQNMPWERIHWFWGDERWVPHDDPQSNYRMACEALLARAPAPAANVHPIPTEGISPEQAAAAYEATLQRFYGAQTLASERPLFDVVLLGIGEDGHTASLFPGQPALDETRRWAVAVRGAKKETRITLTYPALQSGRHAAFLATGAEKRDAVRRARAGDRALPAARLRPAGELQWFVDRAAAGA